MTKRIYDLRGYHKVDVTKPISSTDHLELYGTNATLLTTLSLQGPVLAVDGCGATTVPDAGTVSSFLAP